MMAMPAARKYGKIQDCPEAAAEWGGGAANKELVLPHAILFLICHNSQQSVGTNEVLAVAFAATRR